MVKILQGVEKLCFHVIFNVKSCVLDIDVVLLHIVDRDLSVIYCSRTHRLDTDDLYYRLRCMGRSLVGRIIGWESITVLWCVLRVVRRRLHNI